MTTLVVLVSVVWDGLTVGVGLDGYFQERVFSVRCFDPMTR